MSLTEKQKFLSKKLVEEIPENCESIEGWVGREESKTLMEFASRKLEGVIVEIGTYKGKSAILMALASKNISDGKIYTFDVKEHEGFKENLKKYYVEDCVIQIIETDTKTKWDKPIKLLFIDGSHKYEDVKADYERFEPSVVKDGIICFHDSDLDEEPDVKRYIANEILDFCPCCMQPVDRCRDPRFEVERKLGNMLCLRKIKC